MTNFNYTHVIAEIVEVAKMPTDCIDAMEEKDYYHDMSQRTIEAFIVDCKEICELKAILATASVFGYNVRPIEEAIATLQHKQRQSAQFDFEFEMATLQREEDKHHHMESLFVAYEITQAAMA